MTKREEIDLLRQQVSDLLERVQQLEARLPTWQPQPWPLIDTSPPLPTIWYTTNP